MGLALDGLGGFPTDTIVTQLMRLEQQAKIPLTNKQTSVKNEITALQGLNAKMSSVLTNALSILGKSSYRTTIATPEKVWEAAKATSSNTNVTVSSTAGADLGEISFDVQKTALNKVVTINAEQFAKIGTDGKPEAAANPPQTFSDRVMASIPPVMSIVVGNQITTIKPTSGSAQDIAKAINSAKDAGVTATAVRVGEGKYVLQVTGKHTGKAEGEFAIYAGDLGAALNTAGEGESVILAANKVEANNAGGYTYTFNEKFFSLNDNRELVTSTALGLGAEKLAADLRAKGEGYGGISAADVTLSGAVVQRARDAQITLWSNSEEGQPTHIYSASNTFKNLLENVDVTVGAVDGETQGKLVEGSTTEREPLLKNVKVTVDSDASAASSAASKLAGSIDLIFSEIASRTASVTKDRGDGSGETYTAPGVLGTNSGVRRLRNELTSLIAGGVTLQGADGTSKTYSLADFGISLNKEKGATATVKFDETKFKEAMEKDPNLVRQALTKFATDTAKIANDYSDKDDGLLSSNVKSLQSTQEMLSDRALAFDARLRRKQEALQRQFSALQTALNSWQSKGTWLTSQLATLPTNS